MIRTRIVITQPKQQYVAKLQFRRMLCFWRTSFATDPEDSLQGCLGSIGQAMTRLQQALSGGVLPRAERRRIAKEMAGMLR